jgi:hypothetical protein
MRKKEKNNRWKDIGKIWIESVKINSIETNHKVNMA